MERLFAVSLMLAATHYKFFMASSVRSIRPGGGGLFVNIDVSNIAV